LRPKESIYSLFWGALNLESNIGPEAIQTYDSLVDLLAKLKELQQVDPNLIVEDYNGLTISEMIRRCQEMIERSEMYQFVYSVVGRKLFITSLGFTGIGVPTVQKGDLITILFGFRLPFVIRDHGSYQTFVGASRVGGVMDGELVPFYEQGLFKKRSFVIH
jgi:hypothetical protein